MARKPKSLTKTERRKLLEPLYPDAVAFFAAILGDIDSKFKTKLVDGSGKRRPVSVAQQLDVAKIIVDQVAGKAPTTAANSGGDQNEDPVKTVEFHLSYENGADLPGETHDPDLIPVDDPQQPQDRDTWLKEELAGMGIPDAEGP